MFDAAMHWLGYGLCHQLTARSFIAGGHQLPVCARDTGIYVGFVVSFVLIAVLDRGRHRVSAPPAWLMGLGVVFVMALLWDGVTSYAGFRTTTNLLRLVTGVGTGFALPLAVMPVLNVQLWRRREGGRILGTWFEALVWCLAVPLTIAALWWGGPLLGIGYPLLVAVAIIATFSAVNLIVVSLVPRFEQRLERLRDLWPAVLIAVAATVVELALADWLRVALLSLVSQR
jgi:uncharacterized membrane protein